MGKREIHRRYWWRKMKDNDHWEYPGPYGRILKWILKKRV
jgi:hypothetical protein